MARPLSSTGFPALLTLALTLTMLVAGLNPRGFDGNNGVHWQESSGGVRFERGIAHTPSVLEPAHLAGDGHRWTWQIALRAEPRDTAGFGVAAVLYSGSDTGQIQVAQWRNRLLVMSGDDYPHQLRGPRLTYELEDDQHAVTLAIVHDKDGAILFIDGEAVSRTTPMPWPPLASPQPARLVLGSTVSGQYPWQGTISAVTLYGESLTMDELSRAAPLLDFDLQAIRQCRTQSLGTLAAELHFPRGFAPPQLRALTWPDDWRTLRRALVMDVAVNLLGFVPFGFCATWLALAVMGRPVGWAMATAVLVGVLLSLAIELAQVWVPTRDSSLLDLLMNGAGTALGATAFAFRPRNPRSYASDQ